jgi:hypothetical protein
MDITTLKRPHRRPSCFSDHLEGRIFHGIFVFFFAIFVHAVITKFPFSLSKTVIQNKRHHGRRSTSYFAEKTELPDSIS